ncbi:stage III sporulation protein AA [Kyrpidia spormannii]|uniref:Stage III sporulation protein AA n=1 Tax=Kyrpidia spormannii TaxID=2055160 RepID=A0A2K8N4Y9_9BACL|nr:stage III sporulation protein AA [Kyrpidia spormannii]ATY84393.1 stage III sporulation protein AA [Kyrpidia spormannii]
MSQVENQRRAKEGEGNAVPGVVLRLMPGRVRDALRQGFSRGLSGIEEIRIRRERPVQVCTKGHEGFLTEDGRLARSADLGMVISTEELMQIVQGLSQSSLYALEEELRRGYITLPGGHRVGLAGRAVVAGGRIQTQVDITGLNFRIAKPVVGVSRVLAPWLIDGMSMPASTLILSPPQCGKTTLLRDLAYHLSIGAWHPRVPPLKVAVVDERSELAGTFQGRHYHDLGPRTDVLDGCPKAEGMMMMVRSMSPEVLITDEVGGAADIAALMEAVGSGVVVLASAHAASLADAESRPALRPLLEGRLFRRYVVLSRRQGPMTVEGVFDEAGRRLKRDQAKAGTGRPGPVA